MNNDRFKFRVFYGGDYSITPYCTINMNGKVWLDTSIMRGDGLGDFDTDIIDITDKCTVEQCTGLRDKNGNLIYIGDIAAIKRKGLPDDIFTVEYDEDGIGGIYPFNLHHYCGDDCCCELRDFPEYACEIIGNIHEKKEQK